jgi:hypothetical protein
MHNIKPCLFFFQPNRIKFRWKKKPNSVMAINDLIENERGRSDISRARRLKSPAHLYAN